MQTSSAVAQSSMVEKPTKRRYLTLIMIFITVVICYVDRANLSVASDSIKKEFGITKIEMGYVFSAFSWTYTVLQIPGGWFLDRVGFFAIAALNVVHHGFPFVAVTVGLLGLASGAAVLAHG